MAAVPQGDETRLLLDLFVSCQSSCRHEAVMPTGGSCWSNVSHTAQRPGCSVGTVLQTSAIARPGTGGRICCFASWECSLGAAIGAAHGSTDGIALAANLPSLSLFIVSPASDRYSSDFERKNRIAPALNDRYHQCNEEEDRKSTRLNSS